MEIEPPVTHLRGERGRVMAQGRRTDSGERCTLLLINETDGSWSFHGLGAPGVKLSKAEATELAQGILQVTQ